MLNCGDFPRTAKYPESNSIPGASATGPRCFRGPVALWEAWQARDKRPSAFQSPSEIQRLPHAGPSALWPPAATLVAIAFVERARNAVACQSEAFEALVGEACVGAVFSIGGSDRGDTRAGTRREGAAPPELRLAESVRPPPRRPGAARRRRGRGERPDVTSPSGGSRMPPFISPPFMRIASFLGPAGSHRVPRGAPVSRDARTPALSRKLRSAQQMRGARAAVEARTP